MKNKLTIGCFFLLVVVLIGCNQSGIQENIHQQPQENNSGNTGVNVNISNSKKRRAIQVLKQIKPQPLPFQSQFDSEYNTHVISKLISSKGKPHVLDSLYKSSDFVKSWLYNEEFPRISDSAFCEFVAPLESPLEDYELLIYIIKDQVKDYTDFSLVYLVVVDKQTFNMVSNSHIGMAYLEDKPLVIDAEYRYSSAQFKIDKSLRISTQIKEEITESFSPYYEKQQQVTAGGNFILSPTKTYNYSTNNTYFYLDVADSISLHTIDFEDELEEDFLYHHLNMMVWNTDSNAYKPKEFTDTLIQVNDHKNRKWLDVFKYTLATNNASCKVLHETCYDAHYKNYFYTSIEDRIIDRVYEVNYTHLPSGDLELKTRFSLDPTRLQYQDWNVIVLSHQALYGIAGDSYLSNSAEWSVGYYFIDADKLPYKVEKEVVPKLFEESEEDKQSAFLNKVYKNSYKIKRHHFKGEKLESLKALEFTSPHLFLEGDYVDSNWQFLAILKPNERINRMHGIFKNKISQSYYLVEFPNFPRYKSRIISLQTLPSNTAFYSTTDGLYIHQEFENDTIYRLQEKWWMFDNFIGIEEKTKVVKSVKFSDSLERNILSISNPSNRLSFHSIYKFILLIKGNQRKYKDHKNRNYIEVSEFTSRKSASYVKFNYTSDTDVNPENVLEIHYTIKENGVIHLKFRSSLTKDGLNTVEFIPFILYPKGHKKYKPWNAQYFNTKSIKELKRRIKDIKNE